MECEEQPISFQRFDGVRQIRLKLPSTVCLPATAGHILMVPDKHHPPK